MVDKVTTVPKTKIGEHVGRFADEDMVRLNRRRSGLFGNCCSNYQRATGIAINLEHACQGLPIYVWRDGRVVEIPPDELRARSILLVRGIKVRSTPPFVWACLSEVLGSTRDRVF